MNTVRVTYFGMEGEGPTVTKAKLDAGAKIEAALKGYYTPKIVSWRGYAILVYREPSGWHNRIIVSPEDGIRSGPVYGSNTFGDKEDAIKQVQEHLADIGWTPEDGETPPPFLKARDSIAEYVYKAKFRRRYAEGRARGMNDNDAHSFAGCNPARPELWMEPKAVSA